MRRSRRKSRVSAVAGAAIVAAAPVAAIVIEAIEAPPAAAWSWSGFGNCVQTGNFGQYGVQGQSGTDARPIGSNQAGIATNAQALTANNSDACNHGNGPIPWNAPAGWISDNTHLYKLNANLQLVACGPTSQWSTNASQLPANGYYTFSQTVNVPYKCAGHFIVYNQGNVGVGSGAAFRQVITPLSPGVYA